jgi:hypothetical protein
VSGGARGAGRIGHGGTVARRPKPAVGRGYLADVSRLSATSAGLLAVAAAAFACSPAAAQLARPWATVNVCDTAGHPDAIGIRGSMPGGGGRAVRLFMRFRVEYRAPSGRWRALGPSGDSGWVAVGSGRRRARQAGRTFTITPPGTGPPYVLRGVVSFRWRRHGPVVRSARRTTTGGHGRTRGADPAGHSAGTCRVA